MILCVAMLESKMENPKAGFLRTFSLGKWICSLSVSAVLRVWNIPNTYQVPKYSSQYKRAALVYHVSGCFRYTVTDAPVSGQNITIHHHCWIFLDLMQVPWFSWLRPHPWVSAQECELIMAKKWPCRRISKHRSRFSRESPSFSLDRAK